MRYWDYCAILVVFVLVTVGLPRSMDSVSKPSIDKGPAIRNGSESPIVLPASALAIIPENDILSHLRPTKSKSDGKEPAGSRKKASVSNGHARGLRPMFC